MRILLKLLFFVPAIIISFAAQSIETVHIAKKLRWTYKSDASKTQFEEGYFVHSNIDEQFGGLPYLIHREQLRSFGEVVSVQFTDTQTDAYNGSKLSPDQHFALQSDWQVKAIVDDGGGIPYLVVSVVPIRKSSSGQLERLLSFEMALDIQDGPRPTSRALTFASNSVLSEGTWYKIATGRDGVYRIDKTLLNQLGINTSTLNPQAFNVYGNGGALLPEDNSVERYDDLQKCAIFYSGNSNNTTFGDNDFFLFYAKGPDTWKNENHNGLGRNKWTHKKHFYSDSAYYFIRIDDTDPKRIQIAAEPSQPATHTVDKFQDFQYIENDVYNLLSSGRRFFGDLFDVNTSGQFNFNVPNVSTVHPASLEAEAAVRSIGGASSFTFSVAGQSQQTISVATGAGSTDAPAQLVGAFINFTPTSSPITVNVQLNKYSNTADVKGYLDYLRLNVTRWLVMSGNQMKFRDTTGIGAGRIGEYTLTNTQASTRVWDVTDITTPREVSIANANGTAQWKYNADQLYEFIAFNSAGMLTPVAVGAVPNQNLHAAEDIDLVIISAPRNLTAAKALADIHIAQGHSVLVTTPLEVFNEFSSGNPDVVAFRMLMKMLYDRANGDQDKMPKNLLLFGDGDCLRNKGVSAFLGSNVLVFETDESLMPLYSSVSDDYFVLLSDNDTGSLSGSLDAGVGRICASDPAEAMVYVEKVKAYLSQNTTANGAASCSVCDENDVQSPFGNWRNTLVFVADDQDGSGGPNEQVHLEDAESFAQYLKEHHPEYNIYKIYMDAYKQVTTPGGERYPEVEEEIRTRVQNGALLVTYIGHGGEKGWAHERVLDENTIMGWTNLYRMPVFLTATCELARYDYSGYKSAGEKMIFNPKGGAIAMLTTTRVVTVGGNRVVDEKFFNVALRETEYPNLNLGKINMLTKNALPAGNTSRSNFSLLGDPMLQMAYPKYDVKTTHINGIEIESFTDTLKALQEVEMRGVVVDESGNVLTDFNGSVYPTVYDKETHVYTQNNDGGVVQEFRTFNRIIFKGRATVTNGQFKFQFVVPYDINYSVGKGRVSYYALAGNQDGHGYNQDFNIGSSLQGVELNKVGPEIDLFLNDSTFVSGGITDTRPYVIARLSDENGINTVGNGIGHDITLILDNNVQNPIVLNDYYESDLDTYKSGKVKYQLTNLEPGNHTLTLKAWDVHNNSSVATLDFLVTEDSEIALKQVLNYPNPFTTSTQFMFEHNQSCETLDVRIQIFTVSGKLVKTITQTARQNGFRSEPIPWDGRDDFGDRIGKGVYVYRVEIRNSEGQKAEQYEKLVILK